MNTAPDANPVPGIDPDAVFTIRAGVNRHAGIPTLARVQSNPTQVRCECRVCGCHAFSMPGVRQSGCCGNCGSMDLQPLEGALEAVTTLDSAAATVAARPRRIGGGFRARRAARGPGYATA